MLNLNPEEGQQRENTYYFEFNGSGSEYFKIWLLNFILNVVTLGFYYPWARASKLNYLYEHTEFNGSPFEFHGTGMEMFKGFIKVYVVYFVLMIMFYYSLYTMLDNENSKGLFLFSYFLIIILSILIVPLAIHGSVRYRAAKSSWRGIFFSYHGSLGELYKLYFKGIILTMITFGFYSFWMRASLRRYVYDHLKLGDMHLIYDGDGEGLFKLHIKLLLIFGLIYFILIAIIIGGGVSMANYESPMYGFLGFGLFFVYLIVIFLGLIFQFWRLIIMNGYHMDNTYAKKDTEKGKFMYNDGVRYNLKQVIPSAFVVLCTLGFGLPYATVKLLKFFFNELEFKTDIDLNTLTQDTNDYNDAAADDLTSFLDIDLT